MGNETEKSKYLNKILKNKAKKDIGTLKMDNGEYTTPGIGTLEELATKHNPLPPPPHTHRQKGHSVTQSIDNKSRIKPKI